MKKHGRMAATLLLLLIFGAALLLTARQCYILERKQCFKQLTGFTRQICNDIKKAFENDRDYLEGITGLFEDYDLTDYDVESFRSVSLVLSTLGGNGMISHLELLLPGDKLLTAGGELLDVSGQLSFTENAALESHISRRCTDFQNPGTMILRHFVPIQQHGQVQAVLCGVIDLSKLPEMFSIPEGVYGNNVQLYVIEGKTGNFLQDSWHDTLGNVFDLGTRQTKTGYSWDQFLSDLKDGNDNTVVFLSKTAGEYFYSYTSPVGVEDWMVTTNVLEDQVFEQAQTLLYYFYGLSAFLFALSVFYCLWVYLDIRRDKNISEEQLRQVRYLLDIEKTLFDAHLHPKQFQDALQKTADYLTAETAFFWLVGDLPAIERKLWTNQDTVIPDQTHLTEVLIGLSRFLQENRELISYDMDTLYTQFPIDGKELLPYHIRNLMLIPVTGLDGELSIIMGACNMKRRWNDSIPLQQVSLSFSMAINHYEAYCELDKMGRIDSLTGLLNRNSYHAAINHLKKEMPQAIACVYMDVNGLHELNNRLGHQSGDQMLTAVADTLRCCFPTENMFRIGGDEFVVLCQNKSKDDLTQTVSQIRQSLQKQGYSLSIGIACQELPYDMESVVIEAEKRMRLDKVAFYDENGKDRRMR